jgi:hypothetical protein
MYKSTPITKKAKTAGEYNSALKQTLLDASAQRFKDSEKKPFEIITKSDKKGTEGTPSTTKTVEREKPQVGGYRRACGSKNDGSTGTDPETGDTFVCKQAEKGKEPEETEKVEVTTPGTEGTPDETTYNATEIMRKDQGKNVGNLENREMNRVIKKAGKDVRRGEIKQSRIADKKAKFEAKRGKDIAPGQKGYRKQQRLKAKETETTRELGGFQDRMDNALAGQASGKGLNENYRRADVAKTAADFDDDVQVKQDQLRQDMARAAQSDSKRLANEAIKIGTNGFTLAPTDTTAGDSFINKYSRGMFMKKSPMKKNYFKK